MSPITLTSRPIHHIGYGLMGLTWTPTPPSTDDAIKAMRTAVDLGSNFWNGGVIYGSPSYNSLHLLRAYCDKYPEDAEKVVLSIKGGINPEKPGPDSSEDFLRKEVNTCLEILGGKKSIDIYETARVDPGIPIEVVMESLLKMKDEGMVGGIGLSECSASTIHRAAKVGKVDVVEVEVSIWSTEIFENGVADACAQHSIVIAAYSPLGKGFLTGKVVDPGEFEDGDHRKHMPRFQAGTFESNFKLVEGLKQIAAKKACQPSQLALAWVKAQGRKKGGPVIVPIPGTSKVERIRENLTEVELTEEELKELDELVQAHTIIGGRYPEQVARLCFGDSISLEEWNKKG